MTPGRLWVCPYCRGARVQYTAWIDANTGAVVDGEPPRDANWCADCERETPYLLLLPKTGADARQKAK